MPQTRTQSGKTPRKTSFPDMVETPGRRTRSKKSFAAGLRSDSEDPTDSAAEASDSLGLEEKTKSVRKRKTVKLETYTEETSSEEANGHANGVANGHANGHANGSANGFAKKLANGHVNGVANGSANGHAKELANGHANGHANGYANGYANGHSNGQANGTVKKAVPVDGWIEGMDPRVDYSGHFEFGGSLGVFAIMMGFPVLMYYMWIGATYFDGKAPMRESGESFVDFFKRMAGFVYEGAYPSAKAWAMYWIFFIVECVFYIYMPGIKKKGKPLLHEGGKQLDYYCSGVASWYATLAIAGFLHFTGLFKLQTIIDEFGPLMSVSILSGILMSFYFYISAFARGKQHRLTGYPIYDFFMGAELNPRLFYWLDFKMFFEVRIPWYILFLVSVSTAARQYERYGYVSAEVWMLVMAHFLYANACSKGEECIVTTWDMYYEKLGFMLTFWNLSGVPLSYCHCAIYLANHDPSTYHWNRYIMVVWFIAYLFVYWVWDTTNSQKNRFRSRETGDDISRKAFPQLPWQVVENPRIITSPNGTILADGWYGKARKIHYTCDLFFALSWAMVTGFNSPFPWFYPVFFTAMIIHRATRDIQKCRRKYGEAWKEYERLVPYLFIPYVF